MQEFERVRGGGARSRGLEGVRVESEVGRKVVRGVVVGSVESWRGAGGGRKEVEGVGGRA